MTPAANCGQRTCYKAGNKNFASRRQIVQNRVTSASILDLMLTVPRTGRISGQRYAPPSRKCIMFVPALFNCFFPSSPMSDGPIHVIKYSNSIQEINWLYSLFASVIPGVSTRSLDRTKLIVYTTSTCQVEVTWSDVVLTLRCRVLSVAVCVTLTGRQEVVTQL